MSTDVRKFKVQTTANTENHGKLQSTQTYELDFSDVERDELIEFARRSLTIELQDKARRTAKKEGQAGLAKFDHVELNVRDYLDEKPQRKDSATKVAEQLAKMSQEEREAVLAQFNDSQE